MTVMARIRLVAEPTRRSEFLKTLRSVLGPTEVEPGCLECHISQDARDANVLYYFEHWRDRETLIRHLNSDRFRKLLSVIDDSQEPPQVSFDSIEISQGFELIANVRIAREA